MAAGNSVLMFTVVPKARILTPTATAVVRVLISIAQDCTADPHWTATVQATNAQMILVLPPTTHGVIPTGPGRILSPGVRLIDRATTIASHPGMHLTGHAVKIIRHHNVLRTPLVIHGRHGIWM